MRVQAVCFDMDGVLVDSEPLWHEAEIHEFGVLGLKLTPADCMRTTGLRIDEVVAYWRARHPWTGPDAAEVAARIVARVIALIERRGEARPGAREAVAFLAGRGLRLALASSSDEALIAAVLRRLGLDGAFEVVCSAQREAHGKPHPAVYLRAAGLLGLPPHACLAIEDSANGLRSAVAAGMPVIAVPDQPVAPEALALAIAVLGSLEELPAWWARGDVRGAPGV